MSSVLEVAGSILAHAFEQTEISAQNITNMTAPGYKARRWSFDVGTTSKVAASDFSPGQLQTSGNPLDLAISGTGFFVVRSPDGVFYTRDGRFARGEDGKIVTGSGLSLQDDAGRDLIVSGNSPKIETDGTVLLGSEPVGRVATVDITDKSELRSAGGGLYTAPDSVVARSNSTIRQGMLETSNVSTADEMISIMSALRSAESGQRILQVYDDLMGRTIDAFRSA